MYPESFFHLLTQKTKKNWRFAFGITFCTGLLVHLFRLTNHLLTWDSVYNFHSSQNAIHLGRCFLTLSCGLSSYYDIQWINGLFRKRRLFSCSAGSLSLFPASPARSPTCIRQTAIFWRSFLPAQPCFLP